MKDVLSVAGDILIQVDDLLKKVTMLEKSNKKLEARLFQMDMERNRK